jgi:hypothetical protein
MNGCLACFPNWHVSQTFDITSSVPNLGRPPTRFLFLHQLEMLEINMTNSLVPLVKNCQKVTLNEKGEHFGAQFHLFKERSS